MYETYADYPQSDSLTYEIEGMFELPVVGYLEKECDELIEELKYLRYLCGESLFGSSYRIDEEVDYLRDVEIGDEILTVVTGKIFYYYLTYNSCDAMEIRERLDWIAGKFKLDADYCTHVS